MTSSHLDRRFGRKIQVSLLVALFSQHRVEIADTTDGKNNQVPGSVDIADLDKPGLGRPLVRRCRLIVETGRDIIDPYVFWFHVIGILH